MTTDVNELNTPGEDMGEIGAIDYDAPEPGSFPPTVKPGTYKGLFKLAETDPFGTVEVEGKKYLQVTHSASIDVNGEAKEINFLRASWYQSEKMRAMNPPMNSAAAELTRALGIRLEGKLTPERWKDALRQADGRVQFTADYGWELYCRNCSETTVSTTPNKKKKQVLWPKNAQGEWEPTVRCPKCSSAAAFGNVRLVRYHLPDKQAQTVGTVTAPTPVAAVSEDIPF